MGSEQVERSVALRREVKQSSPSTSLPMAMYDSPAQGMPLYMSYSLNSLKGVLKASIKEVIRGDVRSLLDYSSYLKDRVPLNYMQGFLGAQWHMPLAIGAKRALGFCKLMAQSCPVHKHKHPCYISSTC